MNVHLTFDLNWISWSCIESSVSLDTRCFEEKNKTIEVSYDNVYKE